MKITFLNKEKLDIKKQVLTTKLMEVLKYDNVTNS